MVELMGIEPTTPCLQSRCSSQLSYSPVWSRRDTAQRMRRVMVAVGESGPAGGCSPPRAVRG